MPQFNNLKECLDHYENDTTYNRNHAQSFNLIGLLDYFKSDTKCKKHIKLARWPQNKVICPHCQSPKYCVTKTGYKCMYKHCRKPFSILKGTIFENTKQPLRIWFAAILIHDIMPITSVDLSLLLGISQPAAWLMLHKIRVMSEPSNEKLSGLVQGDETFVHKKNKFDKKKGKRDRNKKIIFGAIEEEGKVTVKHIKGVSAYHIRKAVNDTVEPGSYFVTDQHPSYLKVCKENYKHRVVNHTQGFVAGKYHTQKIDRFWRELKNELFGVYGKISNQHTQSYINDAANRYNSRSRLSRKPQLNLNKIETPLTYSELKERKQKRKKSKY